MDEQHDVIVKLGDAGILAGVRWAYESATRRALETYSEADGHDAAWLGNTRFTLFRLRRRRARPRCALRRAFRPGSADHAPPAASPGAQVRPARQRRLGVPGLAVPAR